MDYKLNVIGSASAVMFASASWGELNVVLSSIASILAIMISILTLIGLLVKWFKNATADGKITTDEIKEGVEILTNGVSEIKDEIENTKEKKQ